MDVACSRAFIICELIKHVPAPAVKVYSGMAEAMKHNDFNQPDTTLETLLGRPPVSLTEFLKSLT